MKKRNVLAILPISIGGRLTTSSLIDGLRQNGCEVTVYDELFDKNLQDVLKQNYDYIAGYDYSGLKIKIDNNLNIPSINYFSDDIRSKTSGPEWEKYIKYLENDDNYTFYWDKVLCSYENFKNIYYLPHFVNTEIYTDKDLPKDFDIMFAGRLDTEYRLSFFEELFTKLPNLRVGWFAIERHYKDALKRSKYPEFIERCYQGFIDNEPDMADAINRSKIIINMNSQGISSLNYRTIQAAACKTLIISDFREELALFEGSMPYYEDFSDLLFKIEGYLDNEEAYNKVTEECQKIVRLQHNSNDCVRYILKTVS